jgi:hypothetical protein
MQDNLEFEASLGYRARPVTGKKKKKGLSMAQIVGPGFKLQYHQKQNCWGLGSSG